MHILLSLILSFYPALFVYQSLPLAWAKQLDILTLKFLAFALIFACTYLVMKKFVSLGYHIPRSGILRGVLLTVFTVVLALISFYVFLPGETVYASPKILDSYVLKNPYMFLWLIAPFVYLFFE